LQKRDPTFHWSSKPDLAGRMVSKVLQQAGGPGQGLRLGEGGNRPRGHRAICCYPYNRKLR